MKDRKGLELLLSTIRLVRNELNPKLQIDGIVITMLDKRTNFSKNIIAVIRETYGEYIRIFTSEIPVSIKAAEAAAAGKSIFLYAGVGKVAQAYGNLVAEVLGND